MGNIVNLVHIEKPGDDLKQYVKKALDLNDFKIDKPVRSVSIKPNLCYYWDASTGYTTDPMLVAEIIDWVRGKFGESVDIKIVESDATAMRTKLAFLMLGYEKIAKEKHVDLFNLSNDTTIIQKVFVDGNEIKYIIPQLLLDTDLFINVPKLKIMRETKITCAMKNIFGCIAFPRKITYHHILHEAIVGINKILHPHLTVVDGLVALGKFPINLNLIMASVDPFSIDWVASKIMGYNPLKVKFLNIAKHEHIWSSNGIETKGENVDILRKKFPKEGLIPAKHVWDMQLKLLNMYFKIVGDVIPPVLQEI